MKYFLNTYTLFGSSDILFCYNIEYLGYDQNTIKIKH